MPIDSQQLLKYSGFVGLGLVVVGGFLYYRERQQATLGLTSGLGRNGYTPGRYQEAPFVSSRTRNGMTATLRESAGEMPIEQRIASIQKMVAEGVEDPEMRRLAFAITKHCAERDGMCEAKAIYKWMRKNVKYSGDVAPIKRANGETEGIDLYQSGKRTVQFGAGDCDDQSALVATLASVIGLTTRLRVTGQPGESDYSHIYPVVGLEKFAPTYWVAVDTTLPGRNKFGVEYPNSMQRDFDA